MPVAGCFVAAVAGSRPGGDSLSFASPKESKQKKGDPTVCDPSLRYGHLAVLGPAGVSLELAALRQSRALIRLALRSSAHSEGGGKNKYQQPISAERAWRVLLSDSDSDSDFFPQARPGWACAAQEKRDQGRALFEPQASLRAPPLFLRSAGCP